jgi:FeS assembly protein IscX
MELRWTNVFDIAIELAEQYPEIDPYTLSFVKLHEYVCALEGFTDNPEKSNEKILEAIQTAWADEIN